MKVKLFLFSVVLSAAAMLLLSGCGSKADENKPMSDVKAESETMSVEKLRATAMAYKETIEAKRGELEKITAKLGEIPLAEVLGQEAKSLKSDFEKLNESVGALTERFGVYHGKLKELKADVSDLAL